MGGDRAAAASQIGRTIKAWRQTGGSGARGGGAAIPSGGGAPLASGVRERIEPKLGADLSGVRVHTDGAAANAASQLNARAFTVGSDVHFNSGEYAPGTREGDKLLAHELTHVVQGQRSPQDVQRKAEGDPEVSDPSEPAEQEADGVADKVAGQLHGSSVDGGAETKPTEHDAENKATEAPAPISAKLDGIGMKVYADTGAPPSGATPNPVEQRFTQEKTAVEAADTLGGLGAAIGGSAKAGQAPTRLANTERGIARAKAYYQSVAGQEPKAAQMSKAFIDDRYPEALRETKKGMVDAATAMDQKKGTPDFKDVNWDDAQWGGSAKARGALAPENMDATDGENSQALAKGRGGLIKLFSIGQLFGNMAPNLMSIWTRCYGDDKNAAKAAFVAQSAGTVNYVPPADKLTAQRMRPEDVTRAAPDLPSAFTKPLDGAVGFVNEYNDIQTVADGVAKLGLNEGQYQGGGYKLLIPGERLDEALAAAGQGAQAGLGKPPVFNSLLFENFNYIAEDRLAGRTAVGNTSNTGVPDPNGKSELTVTQMPISEFFRTAPQFLPP
jgi:hypothetical protein